MLFFSVRLLRGLAMTVFVMGLFLPFSSFAASPQCECWCGKEGEGATSSGGKASSQLCLDQCKALGKDFLMCPSKSGVEATPDANLKCWEEKACSDVNPRTGQASGVYQKEQPAECLPGFHYCYPVPQQIPLSVSIGGASFVYSIAGYIGTFYRWMLGVGVVFAVVMVIVGGIQYMVSSGSGNVKAATDRIKNAVIGIVLLLSATTMLQLVDPRLLNLSLPPLAQIRPVLLPDGSQTCEAYYDSGYTLKISSTKFQKAGQNGGKTMSSPGACGDKADLSNGPSGASLATDASCYFQRCPDVGIGQQPQVCRIDPDAETGSCVSCTDVSTLGAQDDYFPKPSESFCASLSSAVRGFSPDDRQQDRCVYVSSQGLIGSSEACGLIQVSCGSISSCEDYDQLVQSNIASSEDGTSRLSQTNISAFQTLCKEDPCLRGPCAFGNVGNEPKCSEDN